MNHAPKNLASVARIPYHLVQQAVLEAPHPLCSRRAGGASLLQSLNE